MVARPARVELTGLRAYTPATLLDAGGAAILGGLGTLATIPACAKGTIAFKSQEPVISNFIGWHATVVHNVDTTWQPGVKAPRPGARRGRVVRATLVGVSGAGAIGMYNITIGADCIRCGTFAIPGAAIVYFNPPRVVQITGTYVVDKPRCPVPIATFTTTRIRSRGGSVAIAGSGSVAAYTRPRLGHPGHAIRIGALAIIGTAIKRCGALAGVLTGGGSVYCGAEAIGALRGSGPLYGCSG
jgi:hypothetical protein